MICYVGIDNGVSGSIGVLDERGDVIHYSPTPCFMELNYTKEKRNVTRVNARKLYSMLKVLQEEDTLACFRVFIERPMVNPQRFQASLSAIRALETTLIVLERLKWGVQYVDSREWQSLLLPKGSKGEALKTDSVSIGCRRFPRYAEQIKKHKDADGLLIAEAMRGLRK